MAQTKRSQQTEITEARGLTANFAQLMHFTLPPLHNPAFWRLTLASITAAGLGFTLSPYFPIAIAIFGTGLGILAGTAWISRKIRQGHELGIERWTSLNASDFLEMQDVLNNPGHELSNSLKRKLANIFPEASELKHYRRRFSAIRNYWQNNHRPIRKRLLSKILTEDQRQHTQQKPVKKPQDFLHELENNMADAIRDAELQKQMNTLTQMALWLGMVFGGLVGGVPGMIFMSLLFAGITYIAGVALRRFYPHIPYDQLMLPFIFTAVGLTIALIIIFSLGLIPGMALGMVASLILTCFAMIFCAIAGYFFSKLKIPSFESFANTVFQSLDSVLKNLIPLHTQKELIAIAQQGVKVATVLGVSFGSTVGMILGAVTGLLLATLLGTNPLGTAILVIICMSAGGVVCGGLLGARMYQWSKHRVEKALTATLATPECVNLQNKLKTIKGKLDRLEARILQQKKILKQPPANSSGYKEGQANLKQLRKQRHELLAKQARLKRYLNHSLKHALKAKVVHMMKPVIYSLDALSFSMTILPTLFTVLAIKLAIMSIPTVVLPAAAILTAVIAIACTLVVIKTRRAIKRANQSATTSQEKSTNAKTDKNQKHSIKKTSKLRLNSKSSARAQAPQKQAQNTISSTFQIPQWTSSKRNLTFSKPVTCSKTSHNLRLPYQQNNWRVTRARITTF